MEHEVFAVFAFQRVDDLLILSGAQRGDHQRLRLAAREQGRAVRARQHPDLAPDRADALGVAAVDAGAAQAAIDWIRGIVAEPELGHIYTGKVVKVVDFGAFVNFLGARDGLVHISELAPTRVARVSDVVKQGDSVKVKVLGFDDRGKIKLSMRQVDQESGEDLGNARRPAERAEPVKAVP